MKFKEMFIMKKLKIILTLSFCLFMITGCANNDIIGTYENEADVTIIIEKDGVCIMNYQKPIDLYPISIKKCHWSLESDKVTILYTASMGNPYGIDFTKDEKLTGTFTGSSIEMDSGSIYTKK